MIHLLDTNALILLLNNDPHVCAGLSRSKAEFCIPVVVLFELTFGAFQSKRVAVNLKRMAELPFATIDLKPTDAKVAAEVPAALAAGGDTIGPYDTLIAGQALARNLTLVTHNTREFARVPGLRLEDWQE